MQQISGERLQDRWSSGININTAIFKFAEALLQLKTIFFPHCFRQLTLLGADEGLYAVNVHRDPPILTKLNTFESVHQLKFIPHLSLILLVSGKTILFLHIY